MQYSHDDIDLLAMADKPKQETRVPSGPDQDAEPVDLSNLSATDAISWSNEGGQFGDPQWRYMKTKKYRKAFVSGRHSMYQRMMVPCGRTSISARTSRVPRVKNGTRLDSYD